MDKLTRAQKAILLLMLTILLGTLAAINFVVGWGQADKPSASPPATITAAPPSAADEPTATPTADVTATPTLAPSPTAAVSLKPEEPAPIPAVSFTPSTKKVVAVTFDDGPSGKEDLTPKLLAHLKEKNVRLTFFMLGEMAVNRKDLVKEMFDDGHEIANHSYDHEILNKYGYDKAYDEFNKTQNVLKDITGTAPTLCRYPGGGYNADSRKALRELGLASVLWSVDTVDWKYQNDPEQIMTHYKEIGDGSIVLLHDIHSWSVSGGIKLIDKLLDDGYDVVTVGELFARKGITLVPGRNYSSANFYEGSTDPNNGVEPADENNVAY